MGPNQNGKKNPETAVAAAIVHEISAVASNNGTYFGIWIPGADCLIFSSWDCTVSWAILGGVAHPNKGAELDFGVPVFAIGALSHLHIIPI